MDRTGKLLCMGLILVAALFSLTAGRARASDLVTQTWLPGDCIPQFAVSLPVFGPADGIPRVDASTYPSLTVTMKETEQQVLPTFTSPAGCPKVTVKPTRVWTYETTDTYTNKVLGPGNWPAVTIENKRNSPTTITYVNNLPKKGDTIYINGKKTTAQVQGLVTVDQTLHWADPFGLDCMTQSVDCTANPGAACCQPYSYSPPAVVHLHGGEVPSGFDGGPEAWFTPDGRKGAAYYTLDAPGPGKAIYKYPNTQEPGTPWIHDHALGATRTNVYSGMAAFYFIRDSYKEPKNLPSGKYEIEMAIQDRQFDTNSQLYFPDGSGDPNSNLNGTPPNPDMHPFWIPEFIGDVVVVNGKPWPYYNVEPRRYRFRIVDGSNARFYNLNFGSAPVYVIGADDAYLDAPVKVSTVFIAPGERADIIVDFSKVKGQTITVTNNANVPYPDGLVPGVDQPGMARIMQFRVSNTYVSDSSCNPAYGGCTRPSKMVRLTDGKGKLAYGVKIDKVRQLILKENQGAGGPLEVLVNNTKWDGLRSPSIAAVFPKNGVSELPVVGSTELWEIINLTMDAHPMHTHLVQFQILNRQDFNTDPTTGYPAAWEYAFPGSTALGCSSHQYCPGYGPPLNYLMPNGDGAYGGNPAISPYLVGSPVAPAADESGWKDTAKAMPGEVLRIVVRWAPTSTAVSNVSSGKNMYSFDPTSGPGYVWHCHIIDHEDNEMMRPYFVTIDGHHDD